MKNYEKKKKHCDFLCSYCSFRECQTLKNIGKSSKSCFTCYTIVKELRGKTVLVLHFLRKILGITAAEAFAVLKLPFREESMSRTQVADIQSSRVEWYWQWLLNVWVVSVHCLFKPHTDTGLGLFQSFCPGDVYFPKCCRPFHPPKEIQVSAYQHDNRCNGWHWMFISGRWCCITGFVVPNSF